MRVSSKADPRRGASPIGRGRWLARLVCVHLIWCVATKYGHAAGRVGPSPAQNAWLIKMLTDVTGYRKAGMLHLLLRHPVQQMLRLRCNMPRRSGCSTPRIAAESPVV